jgi:O-methyltransferase involved in polyketide biosynthesis
MGLHTPSGSNGGSNGGSSSRFDPSQPTLFTVEGLIYYLSEEAVRGLFGAMLKVAAPGSIVDFDSLHKEASHCLFTGLRWG